MAEAMNMGLVQYTPQQAEMEVLTNFATHPQGLWALPLGHSPDKPMLKVALERMVLDDKVRLIDVGVVAVGRGQNQIVRVFKITDAGRAHLAQLRVSAT